MAAVLAAGVAYGASAATPNTAPAPAPLRVGAAPSIPPSARHVAPPSDAQKLTLDVALKPRNEAALRAFVTAVSTRGNVQYHHYLSKGQFGSLFGPTPETINATEAALKAQGLSVGSVSPDGLTISVTTTIGGAKAAFGTDFAGYQLAGGKSVYANTVAPQLPGSVAANVSGVIGLDNVDTPTAHLATPKKVAVKPGSALKTAGSKAAAPNGTVRGKYSAPSTCSGLGTDLNTYWASQYGHSLSNGADYYNATSLDSIYGVNNDLAAGDNGTGVSVGVYELESYDPHGTAYIESCYGISTPVAVQHVDFPGGYTPAPANYFTGVGVETALDIQTIAALAPGVSIIDYEGPDAQDGNATTEFDTYQQMVTDDKVKVISSSWGLCELYNSPSLMAAENILFAQAAAQGQSVVAAAGDDGSTDCYRNGGGNASLLAVDDPAGQPYVLAAGGTTMQGLGTPTVSAWNNSNVNGGATGGGVSSIWSMTNGGYQNGYSGAGYSNACSAGAGNVCRQVPDVSALADPNDGYVSAEYYSDGSTTITALPFVIGGTSGAAPAWAAVIALADAGKDCAGNGPVGLVNPALYAAKTAGTPGVLTDVTTGNNVLSYSGYGGSKYQATVGYDMTTGLGTPVAGGVTKAACAAVPSSTASYYVPAGPVRILDTRSAIGVSTTTPVPALGTVKLQVTGRTVNGVTVPASGVTAAVLNVTATQETSFGFASVYPDGTTRSSASNLNFVANKDVPNLVIVPVGANGAVDLYNGSPGGSTHLIADLAGYFTSSSGAAGASTLSTLSPTRIMDTRNGTGVPAGAVPFNHSVSLQVNGVDGIAANATAVVVNITTTQETSFGHITAYPDGVSLPNVSNVNFVANYDVPNLAIVPVGADGKIDFYFGGVSGSTQIIADVSGYFTAGTSGKVFHASAPSRILDTRIGVGETTPGAIAGKGTLKFGLGDGGSTLASAAAVVGNLTVTQPQTFGFLTAYPDGLSLPNVSNLNFRANQDIPNLAIIPNTDGAIDFYNNGTGSTHLIMDVAGYFSAN